MYICEPTLAFRCVDCCLCHYPSCVKRLDVVWEQVWCWNREVRSEQLHVYNSAFSNPVYHRSRSWLWSFSPGVLCVFGCVFSVFAHIAALQIDCSMTLCCVSPLTPSRHQLSVLNQQTPVSTDILAYGPPSISSIVPSALSTTGGLVTVYGSNFGASISTLTVLVDGVVTTASVLVSSRCVVS